MKAVPRAPDRGEPVTILYRGKVKDTLTPSAPPCGASGKDASGTPDQPIFGLWKDREDLTDPASWLRGVRERRAVPGDTPTTKRRMSRAYYRQGLLQLQFRTLSGAIGLPRPRSLNDTRRRMAFQVADALIPLFARDIPE